MRFRGCLAIAVFCLGACAGRFHVVGTVEHPAELPVRAFPPIAIVGATDPDSLAVATLIADRLVASGSPVRLGADAVSGAGIRVDVAIRFSPRAETRWSSRPENVCGPYGCYVRQVTYPYDVLSLVGDVAVRISDPATASVLAERTLAAQEVGTDSEARRAAIRHRIVASVLAWFEPRPERIEARFPHVSGGPYADAVRLGREGRWDQAVVAFRALRTSSGFASRAVEDRAGILVALAIATRFSPEARSAPARVLGEAIAAVDESLALVEVSSARELRVALERQLEEARILAVQRGSLGEAVNESLTVPDSYR